MNAATGWTAVAVVSVVTLAIGAFGLRFSRTTSDFYVASRTVGPLWNASAIGGEYLSAASFLGVAGLVLAFGVDMLWYPVGFATGYLVLLVLVAAPLRRSGAYTIPDFAEARLESQVVRRVASVLVVVVGWLYLLPQLQGAGLTLRTVTGAPPWAGALLVAVVVGVNVVSGGMRSITFVQAFQYWLKLTALLVPAAVLLVVWREEGSPGPATPGALDAGWLLPLADGRPQDLYATYSLMLATFLGTMGLPHVLVRFYTNPDGRATRRTTVIVLALLAGFYLLPPVYAALGRVYASDLVVSGRADAVVLELPGRMLGGLGGDLLGALLAAGAFAAFLSTSSGLTVSVAGALSQDVLTRLPQRTGRVLGGVAAFRFAAVLALAVPLLVALSTQRLAVASSVGLAFAVAASTFCPLLVLGIWWRRLTDVGAVAGLLAGGVASGAAVLLVIAEPSRGGWAGALLAQPAAWAVPTGFAAMVAVSLLTPRRVAPGITRTMVRLHAPEALALDRGARQPR